MGVQFFGGFIWEEFFVIFMKQLTKGTQVEYVYFYSVSASVHKFLSEGVCSWTIWAAPSIPLPQAP